MADNDDVLPKMPDAVEVSVYCDLCAAQLVAAGPTREEAHAKLFALVTERRWHVMDHLAVRDAEQPPLPWKPDLCCDCAAKL